MMPTNLRNLAKSPVARASPVSPVLAIIDMIIDLVSMSFVYDPNEERNAQSKTRVF